jgi:hypothetical protein
MLAIPEVPFDPLLFFSLGDGIGFGFFKAKKKRKNKERRKGKGNTILNY